MEEALDYREELCLLCQSKKNLKQINEFFICLLCIKNQNEEIKKVQGNIKFAFAEINKITDKIYLGNYEGQREKEALKLYGVTSILAIGAYLSNFNKEEFEFLQLDLLDFESEDLFKILKKALLYMDQANCVYVHCHAGISRSASVVIAYLMWKNKMKFQAAKNFVAIKRPAIFPNKGFRNQLTTFEKMLEENQYSIGFLP